MTPSKATRMTHRQHHDFVYIVASRTRVLYCGMTNSVVRRVNEHREALLPGFTAHYQCHRLVWYEHHQYVNNAINREKQIKGCTRAKKIPLIEQSNPAWSDLSKEWGQKIIPPEEPISAMNNCES